MFLHINGSKSEALQQFLLFIILNHVAIMHSELIPGEVAVALIALYSNILTIMFQMHVKFFWWAEFSVAVRARPLQRAVVLQMIFSLWIIEHYLLIGHVHVGYVDILRLVIYLWIRIAAMSLVDLV